MWLAVVSPFTKALTVLEDDQRTRPPVTSEALRGCVGVSPDRAARAEVLEG